MPRQKKLNTPEKRARVGERIKVAATQAGLTLKELAEATDIPQGAIYQYVRGITAIPQELLEKIASVTQVHSDFFDPDKDGRTALALPADVPSPEGTPEFHGGTEPGTRARIQAEFDHLHQLAEAHNHPKRNRAAYLSALEQMLALARTEDNRPKEAWVLWTIGRSRLESNEWESGKQSILTACDIFAAEGMEEYRYLALLDLAQGLNDQGQFAAAQSYLEETLKSQNRDTRWRALISLGNLRYRQHDFGGALRYFNQAAEFLQQGDTEAASQSGEQRKEAMLQLMNHVADVVRATGHYEEAMMLWARCLEQAVIDRKADIFLESLMEVAQCCHLMGRISKAKQHLEQAAVLARLLFEDEARLSVARALLADVLVAMGAVDEARENAREALQIANRVRGPRTTILAALAQAETSLLAGLWKEALRDTQDALNEAKRTNRTREMAQAHEIRARAYLGEQEEMQGAGDEAQAQAALANAIAEANAALDIATRAESVRDRISAHLTLARCHYKRGDMDNAALEARASLELTEDGAVNLNRLMGKEAENVSALLRSPEFDLNALFAGNRVHLPAMEWQAHYIEGTMIAKRVGPEAAFAAMRDAATALGRILSDMSPKEAAGFQKRHPEATAVFEDLQRFALTEDARRETTALLTSARWLPPARHNRMIEGDSPGFYPGN